MLANPQTMAQEMQNGTMMYRDAEAAAAGGAAADMAVEEFAAMQAAPAAAPMPTMSMAPAAAEALMMDKTETATTPIAAHGLQPTGAVCAGRTHRQRGGRPWSASCRTT